MGREIRSKQIIIKLRICYNQSEYPREKTKQSKQPKNKPHTQKSKKQILNNYKIVHKTLTSKSSSRFFP